MESNGPPWRGPWAVDDGSQGPPGRPPGLRRTPISPVRSAAVPVVLLATDADHLHDEVDAALGDEAVSVHRVRSGRSRLSLPSRSSNPTSWSSTCRSGTWAAMATCLSLRAEEGRAGSPTVRPDAARTDRRRVPRPSPPTPRAGWSAPRRLRLSRARRRCWPAGRTGRARLGPRQPDSPDAHSPDTARAERAGPAQSGAPAADEHGTGRSRSPAGPTMSDPVSAPYRSSSCSY